MQVTLELAGHPKANVQRVVLTDSTVVGRSHVCALQIASPSVSRKHCEIRLRDGKVSVIDLGSSNGTFVDSERLPAGEERVLESGARLNVGGIRFLVTYETISPPQQAAPELSAGALAAESSEIDEPLLLSAEDEELAVSADNSLDLEEDALPAVERAEEHEEALVAEAEPSSDEVLSEETDLDELFGEEPSAEESVEATDPTLEPEDKEPILEQDEDEAFAFLTDDDEDTASPPKRPEDSQLGDFLSQLGRD